MSEPIIIEFTVASDVEHAFSTWTAGIDRWWPADHTVSGDRAAEVVMEPRNGGRIFEREPDGTQHEWGRVERCDPPHELVYTWRLGAGATGPTEVRITFTPAADGTAVRIEHGGWERLGPEAPRRRDANLVGWSGLLPHFSSFVDGAARDSA